jgi:hypothetical protein
MPAPDALPIEILIVDLASITAAERERLELYSRQNRRPSIILIDDVRTPRSWLVRVTADALLSPTAQTEDIIRCIESHTAEYPYRAAAVAIRESVAVPHPLNRFLFAAFSEPVTKIRPLARALGISESTLRAQWRRCRIQSRVRLEDVLHALLQLRTDAARNRPDWRMDVVRVARLVVNEFQDPTSVDAAPYRERKAPRKTKGMSRSTLLKPGPAAAARTLRGST